MQATLQEIFEQYRIVIEAMEETPGLYGLDSLRRDLHDELEEHFPGQERALAQVLHNLTSDITYKSLKSKVDNIKE